MADINVTPMVDVMLVLLVIFMVTAPLLVAGVPVQLPKNSAQRISQPNKPVIVTLAADARLYIRDEQVDAASLIPRLSALRSGEGGPKRRSSSRNPRPPRPPAKRRKSSAPQRALSTPARTRCFRSITAGSIRL